MTESKTSSTAPEQGKPDLLTPGAMLRHAREAGGLSHATVGESLHLTVHYIKALENDDYSKLPGLIFVKGYIRSYGQFLKMDVDALIRSYDAHISAIGDSTIQGQNSYIYERRQQSRRRGDQSLGWALVAGLIVVVALGAGWWFVGRDQGGTASATNAAASSSSLAAGTNAAAGAAGNGSAASVSSRLSPTTSNGSAAAMVDATYDETASGVVSQLSAQQPFMSTLANDFSTSSSFTAAGTVSNGTFAGTQATALAADAADNLPTADVTSAATAITATGEVIQGSATEGTPVLQTTVTENGITVIPSADGSRQISMFRTGNDELLLRFAGDSWVEINDGTSTRLYSNLLNGGDTLMIQGTAPFQVLLGNAPHVEVLFNDSVVDITSSIRSDNTARVQLANPGNAMAESQAGAAQ